jgi:dephospho-CoA kinase
MEISYHEAIINMKLVIGLAGLPLAGKETVVNKLEALFTADGVSVSRHRFSDILRDTLDLWGMPHGRANEQILAQIMQRPGSGFPEGVLARAVKNRLSKNPADVGLLDGMRWEIDEKMLREFPTDGIKSIVIYVDADDDHRYARLVARNRSGEAATTREQFAELNRQPNEIFIPEIGSRADIKLMNNYDTVAEFERDIEAVYREKIKGLI